MDRSYIFLGVATVCGLGVALSVRSLFSESGVVRHESEKTTLDVPVPGGVLKDQEHNSDIERLEEISWLWAAKEIYLSKISFLWRETEDDAEKARNIVRPTFKHAEISRFYDEFVSKPIVKGSRRTVILKLLMLLDTDGDCPSVIGKGKEAYKHEAEKEIGDELYQFLSRVPLWKHSLLVARKYVAKFQHDVLLPDALIVSLGHDIGKIPRYYGKIYKSGDHAALSTNILNGVPEYAALPNRTDLNKIIMSHHLLVTGNPLADHLKAADGEARTIEGEGLIAWLDARDGVSSVLTGIDPSGATSEEEPSAPAPESPIKAEDKMKPAKENHDPLTIPGPENVPEEKNTPCKIPAATKTASAPEAPPQPLVPNVYANESGGSPTKGKHICKEMALPEWWDMERLLSGIHKSVDMMISNNNTGKTTWMAVSDNSTGLVWVDERLVWENLKKLAANRDTKLLLADANTADRRDYIYTAIQELGRKQKVMTSLMGNGYYQVAVNVITGGGRNITMFLIPFHPLESFGETLAAMSSRKGEAIQRMVSKIVPKQFEVKQCANV
ncbi:HD domain protein (plasmid) [Pelobacter propionicus DSM 2379]|uniref:HD domain protein n=1 Tax=Pelobacter propionicus (strain DSM 2379 / NBRC 103807 / OttBd1) TaxID=338966 RepID=A0R7S9_PELPD|nr:HD domain protein [Pelobacter propionicus DSM 2379]